MISIKYLKRNKQSCLCAHNDDTCRSGVVTPLIYQIGIKMETRGKLQTSTELSSGKAPPASKTGGWVDPRTGLDDFEKRKISCRCEKLSHDPLVVQTANYLGDLELTNYF
jgi:hypothetical protein